MNHNTTQPRARLILMYNLFKPPHSVFMLFLSTSILNVCWLSMSCRIIKIALRPRDGTDIFVFSYVLRYELKMALLYFLPNRYLEQGVEIDCVSAL